MPTDTAAPTQIPVSSDTTLVQNLVGHITANSPGSATTRPALALTDACLRALQSADERRVVSFA